MAHHPVNPAVFLEISRLGYEDFDAIESALPLGQSHLGYAPDLPANFVWPRNTGGDLHFFCQINLEEQGALPAQGMLWFFWNGKSWGFDPADKTTWRVIHMESPGKLVRWDNYEGTPDPATNNVEFAKASIKLQSEKFKPKDLDQRLGQLFGEQTIGYQIENPRETAQLASHGIYCGDDPSREDPTIQDLLPGAKDWVYLLQIDDAVGAHFFMIRQNDLQKKAFENVWFVYQTS